MKAKKVPDEDRPSKRCHYNKHRKAKMIFERLADAWSYIDERQMHGYMPYICNVCSKWHIGKTAIDLSVND